MANEQADKKVIAALAPFCADRFLKSADATQSAELSNITTNYERGGFLEKAGYTSLSGFDRNELRRRVRRSVGCRCCQEVRSAVIGRCTSEVAAAGLTTTAATSTAQ
jgi:hypothetical protein